jgi:isocitrate lyase
MGKGSTHAQHLVQTEVPPAVLDGWLVQWSEFNKNEQKLKAKLRPHRSGSDLVELTISEHKGKDVVTVIFSPINDRQGRSILMVRNQTTEKDYRKKRLTTLAQLFLIHRYEAESVHYVTPTEDNEGQCQGMKRIGLFSEVNTEVGDVIVATVDTKFVGKLVKPDSEKLTQLIDKSI